jgi:putative MATE family efflux protein
MNAVQDRSRISLVSLAWPIFVENMLRTSLMSVDTFMLSRYSEKAVAAMSLVNSLAFFIQLLYMMVAIGASILISQNLGAGRRREAGQVGIGSLAMISGFSVVLSAVVVAVTRPVVGMFGLEPEVAGYVRQFLYIYGGLSFFIAVNIVQANILRAWGYARYPMYVNLAALALTAAGNALCLFGPFGFPILGVPGVAASTVASQIVACGLFFFITRKSREIELPFSEIRRVPRSVYRAILSVGVPTAGETLAYNVAQIVILSMVAKMGTEALAAYGIIIAVLRYVFMPGISIGSGAQIKVGYYTGAGKPDEAEKKVYRYFAVGFLISLVVMAVLNASRGLVIGVFTDNQKLLALSVPVFLIAQIHEPARNFNTIISPSLKGAGDIKIPVMVTVAFIWCVSVFGSWLLGLKLGLGLAGVWAAMAADEWIRGIIMFLRWRSGVWKRKALVDPGGPG